MVTTAIDWPAEYQKSKEACHQLFVRLLELEEELKDARREYRRSDVVIVAVQAWLLEPEASRAELKQRLEALGVVTPE